MKEFQDFQTRKLLNKKGMKKLRKQLAMRRKILNLKKKSNVQRKK